MIVEENKIKAFQQRGDVLLSKLKELEANPQMKHLKQQFKDIRARLGSVSELIHKLQRYIRIMRTTKPDDKAYQGLMLASANDEFEITKGLQQIESQLGVEQPIDSKRMGIYSR